MKNNTVIFLTIFVVGLFGCSHVKRVGKKALEAINEVATRVTTLEEKPEPTPVITPDEVDKLKASAERSLEASIASRDACLKAPDLVWVEAQINALRKDIAEHDARVKG